MKINNLIGVSGSINSGKDVTGEMLQYINFADNPTYSGFLTDVYFIPNYEIKKCAEKLKEVVAIIIGCKRSDLEDEAFKNTELPEQWWVYTRESDNKLTTQLEYDTLTENQKGWLTLVKITPRMMLQLLGTEGGRRVVHPNIWVNALFADWKPIGSPLVVRAKGLPVTYPKWIITDVRFPENEGVAVTKRDGLLIGIKRYFALKQPKYAHLVDKDNPYDIPSELEELNPKLYKSLTHESEYAMGDHSWCDVVIENNGTLEDLFNNVLNAVKKKEKIDELF